MQTRSRKRAQVQFADQPANDAINEMTLLSLPDVPLLLVLSQLSVRDLGAAGLASPRLSALTRAHPSLWAKMKSDCFWDIEEFLAILPVAPPVTQLVVRMEWVLETIQAHFESTLCSVAEATTYLLSVRVPDAGACVQIIREFGPRLEHLDVSGIQFGLELILNCLRDAAAPALQTLGLELKVPYYTGGCDFTWPQAVVLPGLRDLRLNFDYYIDIKPHASVFEAFRSLLLAHRRQLEHVKLESWQLLPLLDACASSLKELTVEVAPPATPAAGRRGGVNAGLRRMRGLYRLSLLLTDKADVQALLGSCRCPLVWLDIMHCSDAALGALGAVQLSSLQHLVLVCSPPSILSKTPWSEGTLEAALASLPGLLSLNILGLRRPRPYEVLSRLPAAAIPRLAVLVVSDPESEPCSPTDYLGFRDCQELVRRVARPLHLVIILYGEGGSMKRVVLCRHSTDKSTVRDCALWDVGCGQSGVPGVYVKVAHHLDWIRQVTSRL